MDGAGGERVAAARHGVLGAHDLGDGAVLDGGLEIVGGDAIFEPLVDDGWVALLVGLGIEDEPGFGFEVRFGVSGCVRGRGVDLDAQVFAGVEVFDQQREATI